MPSTNAEPTDLAARVRELEDREALRTLIARYCAAVDDRDVDGLLALFTDDAIVQHGDGRFRSVGHVALRELYVGRLAQFGPSFHYPHTHVFAFEDADHASGVISAHIETGEDGTCVLAALRYYDRYVRHAGAWKFAERTLRFWYFMKLGELPTTYCSALRKRWPGEPSPAELPESLATWQRFTAGQP